jgi:hypothetical protein
MNDFAKCNDHECLSNRTCKRYTIETSEKYQYVQRTREPNEAWCEFYVSNKKDA